MCWCWIANRVDKVWGGRGIRRRCKREKTMKQNKIHFTKEILRDTQTSNTHARIQLSITIRSEAHVLKWNAIELYTQLFQHLQFNRIGLQAAYRAIESTLNLSCDILLLLMTDHESAKVDQKKVWTSAENEESKKRKKIIGISLNPLIKMFFYSHISYDALPS